MRLGMCRECKYDIRFEKEKEESIERSRKISDYDRRRKGK